MSDFERQLGFALTAREQEVSQERFAAQRQATRQLVLEQEYHRARERRYDHLGTDPADVFPSDQAEACTDFLERMAKVDYPGTQILEDEPEPFGMRREWVSHRCWFPTRQIIARSTSHWKNRGYPIGISGEVHLREEEGSNNWPKGLYLCEDEQLRLADIPYILGRSAEHPTDLTGYLGDSLLTFTTGALAITYGKTSIIKPDGEIVTAPLPSYWYEFQEHNLVPLLAGIAARNLIR